mmetsp:Transcript_95339/g.221285  ORF Transcript_95339/g.221285 Transcript_95339/m.221285 type:complete len:214 (-) Transcript_95339:261-902(-)
MLALEDADLKRGLAVFKRRKGPGLLGWYDGVAVYQTHHGAVGAFDAERQRRHVQEQHVAVDALLVAQDSGLDCSSVDNGLFRVDATMRLRVDATMRLLAREEVLHELLHPRDPRRAACQHNLIDLVGLHLRVLQHLLHMLQGALEDVLVKCLEQRSRQVRRERGAAVQVFDVDARTQGRAELLFCSLGLSAQLLQGTGIRSQALAVPALESLC